MTVAHSPCTIINPRKPSRNQVYRSPRQWVKLSDSRMANWIRKRGHSRWSRAHSFASTMRSDMTLSHLPTNLGHNLELGRLANAVAPRGGEAFSGDDAVSSSTVTGEPRPRPPGNLVTAMRRSSKSVMFERNPQGEVVQSIDVPILPGKSFKPVSPRGKPSPR